MSMASTSCSVRMMAQPRSCLQPRVRTPLRAIASHKEEAPQPQAPAGAAAGRRTAAALSRRGVLGGISVASTFTALGDARAGFNPDLLQPCSDLKKCRATLAGIEKDLLADPDNIDNKGLQFFFNEEVERLERNKAFVEATSKAIKTQDGRFIQHIVVCVPDIDKAVDFWTKGIGMKVTREREEKGLRTVFVAFGDETLQSESGGNFALELIESPTPDQPAWISTDGPELDYIQLAVGNVRLGAIVEAGGDVQYSYGYLELLAPGGILVKQRVGARRDPVELLAYKVPDLDTAVAFYQGLGMVELERTAPVECREVRKGALGALGFAKRDCTVPTKNVFAPSAAPGSVLMSFSDPENQKDTVAILLTPQDDRNGYPQTGRMYQKLAILANNAGGAAQQAEAIGAKVDFLGAVPGIGTKVGAVTDPAGYGVVFVDYADFEREQLRMK